MDGLVRQSKKIWFDARHPRSSRGKNKHNCPGQARKQVATRYTDIYFIRLRYKNVTCDWADQKGSRKAWLRQIGLSVPN